MTGIKVNTDYKSSAVGVTQIGTGAAVNYGKLIADAMVIRNHKMTESLFKECGIKKSTSGIKLKESLGGQFIEAYSQGSFKEDLTTTTAAGAYTKLLYRTIITLNPL